MTGSGWVVVAFGDGNPRRRQWRKPRVWRGRDGVWQCYIPPTKPEHYDGVVVTDEDRREAPVLAPFGDTYWTSWEEACTFLEQVRKEGWLDNMTSWETNPKEMYEYEHKRQRLAAFLYELAYAEPPREFEVDPEVWENYLLDAEEIIKAMPHLLSLHEVERLERVGFFAPIGRHAAGAS